MDLAEAVGKDWKEFIIDDLPWRVGPLRLDEWADTQAFIKANLPGPVTRALGQIAEAERLGIPPSPPDRQYLLSEARKDEKGWPPQVLSRDWFDALDRIPDGDAFWLWTVLRKYQSTLTLEQARILAPKVGREQAMALVAAAIGVEMGEGKDKAPTAIQATRPDGDGVGSPTGGPSSTRSRRPTDGHSKKSAG